MREEVKCQIVRKYWVIYQDMEDDWKEEFWGLEGEEERLVKEIATFSVRNRNGSWSYYITEVVEFQYKGKSYEFNLFDEDTAEKIIPLIDIPSYKDGYLQAFSFEMEKVKEERERKEDEESKGAKEFRRQAYLKLKKEFEGG